MRHWVFDLDGTLVDSFSAYFGTLETIFNEHGARFFPGLQYPALTERLDLFFEQHLGSRSVNTALSRLQFLSNRDAQRIQPFSGLITALHDLADQGSRIAVWTNRDRESASLILEASGLDRFAEVFISGTCVSRRKPDPEGLLTIIDRFGCDPSTVTMVGDHEHDVTAAKQVGARAVRASWHGYWTMEPCEHADHQFHSVEEFHSWLKAPQELTRARAPEACSD